jgi:hypothetical protein
VRLIDYENLDANDWWVTNQFSIDGRSTRRPDIVLLINGIPIIVIEAKTASRSKPDWREGAKQLGMYAEEIDQLFYTNAYGVGVNETRMMYGVPGRRLQFWLQWRDPWPHEIDEYDEMKVSLYGLFDRSNLLDFIRHFIVFVTKDGKTEKVVVRYQQYLAVKDIVNRATALTLPAEKRRGLIWHTQGSGKTLTMIYAARSLWEDPKLQSADRHPAGGPRATRRPDGPRAELHRHGERARGGQQARLEEKLVAIPWRDPDHGAQVRRHAQARHQAAAERDRDGRRGAPLAGARAGHLHALGAGRRVDVRLHRHADRERRPQHAQGLGLRQGRRQDRALHGPALHGDRCPARWCGQAHPLAAARDRLATARHQAGLAFQREFGHLPEDEQNKLSPKVRGSTRCCSTTRGSRRLPMTWPSTSPNTSAQRLQGHARVPGQAGRQALHQALRERLGDEL